MICWKKNGVRRKLPVVGVLSKSEKTSQTEMKELEVFSIVLQNCDFRKVDALEFEVTRHEDNVVSFVVPAREKQFIERISRGSRLTDVRFYSPMAVFKGEGTVSSVLEIMIGPEKGGYVFDLRIEDTN